MSNIVIKLHNRGAVSKRNLLEIKSLCTKTKLELLNSRLTLEELSNKYLIFISQIEDLAETDMERGNTAQSSVQNSKDLDKTPNTSTSNITQSFGKHSGKLFTLQAREQDQNLTIQQLTLLPVSS